MGSISAFYIKTNGSWPVETYSVAPCATYLNPLAGFLPAENLYRYLNNPLNETNSLNTVYYNSTDYTFIEEDSQYAINTTASSNIVWDLSATRKIYNTGPQFNYFYVCATPRIDPNYRKYFSYLLYPSRLFLRPISLVKNSNSWTLNTSAVVTRSQTFFFDSKGANDGSTEIHEAYVKSTPTFYSLNDANVSLIFNLSACRSWVKYPFIFFTSGFQNVINTSNFIDNKGGLIRPDSTFVTYNVKYRDNLGKVVTLGQDLPEESPGNTSNFKTSYILNQQNILKSEQIYQLLQERPLGNETNLSSSANCVLSAVINLSSSYVTYNSQYKVGNGFSRYPTITGSVNSLIGINYILDSSYFLNTSNSVIGSLSSFRINSSSYTLGTPIANSVFTGRTIAWTTTYPPHYYAYKTSLQSATYGFNTPTDTHNLSFKIKSDLVDSSSAYAKLSSYITTDHNLLKYDLVNNTIKDQELVKFELTGDISVLKKNVIQCYYGEKLNVVYPINVSDTFARGPWIPACSANNFLISYPNTPYGEVNLFIRPTLSSIAGVLAGDSTQIILAEEQQQLSNGIPIFVQELSSVPNAFYVTAAMLSATPNWPTRDLRDTFITWSFYPSTLPVKIESVDSNGNVISTINPNQVLKFSDSTNTVKFSNFGLATVVAVLSSQRYNEVATLSSTQGASQFNPFYLNAFSIGKVGLVDNIHKTRTVTLTARIPYGNSLYDIPIGTNISWVWGFENDFNYKRIPIKAYYGPNRTPYVYGKILPATLLSSIYLEVTPTTSETFPALESVKVEVRNLNNVPPVKSTYEFFLDQFPARKILNADFKLGYTYYQELSGTVLDTNKDQYVMTRPPDDTNYFTLTSNSNSDISPDTTYVWSLSNDFTGQQALTSTVYANHLMSFIIHPKANTTIVTLCALSAVCPGWSDLPNIVENVDFQNTVNTLKHSVANSVTIYTPQDYYKEIVFNVMPEYFWRGSRYLTLTNQTNYSLALAPTAYEHKKSQSQNYFLSANKLFSEYDYHITSNSTFLSTLSSYYGTIELPYHPEFYSLSGMKISLRAYSDIYPSFLPNFFVKPTLKQNGYLKTYSHPITAETFPYFNVSKGFQRSPYLTPYNSVSAITTFNVLTPVIDLSYSRKITANQTIEAFPSNSPVQIYANEGTVTYLVSSNHWVANISVPATNGNFTLFNLKIGDPYEVGYVSNTELNKISFKPVQVEVPYYIPPSTFNNYNSTQWPGERDLWERVNLIIPLADRSWQTVTAYNTAIPLETYVSWYMGVTGQDINIQFAGKGETEENGVVRYSVNFGEPDNRIVIFQPDEVIKYSYLNQGTFYISYDAYYYDGSIKSGIISEPITVRDSWTSYSLDSIRTLQEDDLSINWPYTLDDILIQPNEWGDADIFNTAVERLHANFSYLLNNRNTINTDSPTIFHGWLGCHDQRKYQGIRWFVRNFGSTVEPKSVDFYQAIDSATDSGVSFFTNVKDVAQVGDYIFVLDDNTLRVFKDEGFIPEEILFDNISDFSSEFVSPTKLVASPENYVYVLDAPRNKIVAVGVDIENLGLNFSSNIGGFGKRDEPSRLNAPSDIVIAEDSLYVLDFGNRCVKEYNKDLNWLHTYYIPEFDTDRPIYIAAHYEGLVYVLTESLQIYVIDQISSTIKTIDVSYLNINNDIVVKGMTFDEAGEFIYILTDSFIHKISVIGDYIGTMTLGYQATNESIHKGLNRHLLITTKLAIVKVLDAVNVFGVGLGLPEEFWSLDQIQIKKQNMPSDLEYNKSLFRLNHNILNFRNNLNAKFVKAVESTSNGLITYYALKPVGYKERPVFSEDVENGSVGVGVNELHIPQVLNREFAKLYESLIQIKDFLSISNINLPNYKVEASGISIICPEEFCWSWKGTAGYNLSLPSIRICNVNPISFNELKTNFPVKYATTTSWLSANGKCCVNQSPILR